MTEAEPGGIRAVVLDTNIVLDLLVFNDKACAHLRAAMAQGSLQWIGTLPMREELARVLAYPQIVKSLAHHHTTAGQVLEHLAAQARMVEVVSKAPVTCKDPDDQKFIDLAVAYQSVLLSKDRAVLCMQKRLLALGVLAQSAIHCGVDSHAMTQAARSCAGIGRAMP